MEPVEQVGRTGEIAAAKAPSTREAKQKSLVGRVTSNKMNKTVVVQVEKLRRHRLYHRNLRRLVSYQAHDEENACNVGDVVRIAETRPLSKMKRWRVAEIVKRSNELG